MKKNDISSLVATLEFLDAIGAGDPISDTASNKTTLKIKSVKSVVPQNEEANKSTDLPLAAPLAGATNSQPNQAIPTVRRIAPAIRKVQDYVNEAKQLAIAAKNLTELRQAIESFDGCGLKRTAMNTVFSDGNPNADVMLVGEAPGADEDRQGLPFVGPSGQLLDKMFQAIDHNRKDNLYISNIIPWRPPGNRPPTPEEVAMCLPFIARHIELIAPKLLIFVGGTSAKALLQSKMGISKIRGKWLDYIPHDLLGDQDNNNTAKNSNKAIKATAIFHPSYLLRSPGQKRKAWVDLLKIKSALSNKPT